MDWTAMSEEAWKRGYEQGYVAGVCDSAAEAMQGSIEWHRGVPTEDRLACYICQAVGGRKYIIRPAVYKRSHRCYLVDDFDKDGGYFQKRLSQKDVPLWAEIRDPFSMQISFTVPEKNG